MPMPIKPKHDGLAVLLQDAGLRPTRQRLALAGWLFDGTCRHVTAEQVHAAARRARLGVSLATVYNTVNSFREAGLLRSVALADGRVCFDTNRAAHYHIYDEDSGEIADLSVAAVKNLPLPKLPRGKVLCGVDITLRVRARAGTGRERTMKAEE